MWRSIIAHGVPAALVLLVTAAPGWAQPAEIGIQRLALANPSIEYLRFNRLSLTLVGDPSSKEFGVAVDGEAVPNVKLTGHEKPVIRLYTGCSVNGKERGPDAANVATVELSTLPAESSSTSPAKLTATHKAEAFVPMKDINCAVLDVQSPESPAEVGIKRLALANPGIDYLRFNGLSLTLVGDPSSKEFGVAVDGEAVPNVKLAGHEKPVIRLYTGCASANGKERGPNAVNVATVELSTLPAESSSTAPAKLTATHKAEAFVSMKDINCAVLDVQ